MRVNSHRLVQSVQFWGFRLNASEQQTTVTLNSHTGIGNL